MLGSGLLGTLSENILTFIPELVYIITMNNFAFETTTTTEETGANLG